MVKWLIYHDGLANENSRIALSNDPVFNNLGYPPALAGGIFGHVTCLDQS